MASPFTGGLPREAVLTVQNPNSSLKNMPTALLEREIMPFVFQIHRLILNCIFVMRRHEDIYDFMHSVQKYKEFGTGWFSMPDV